MLLPLGMPFCTIASLGLSRTFSNEIGFCILDSESLIWSKILKLFLLSDVEVLSRLSNNSSRIFSPSINLSQTDSLSIDAISSCVSLAVSCSSLSSESMAIFSENYPSLEAFDSLIMHFDSLKSSFPE